MRRKSQPTLVSGPYIEPYIHGTGESKKKSQNDDFLIPVLYVTGQSHVLLGNPV